MASSGLMKAIYVALFLLYIDAVISLSLVSSMVAFLHGRGGQPFEVRTDLTGSFFNLPGEPAHLLTDHGHTTNGAGGTGIVLVWFGGCLALWLEHRSRAKYGKSSPFYYLWALITLLSWLLTLTALIYTYVLTNMHSDQKIDLGLAESTSPKPYPRDSWTPEDWYTAVNDLSLVHSDDHDLLKRKLRLIRGWRYNLIPFMILGFVLMVLVILELLRFRRSKGRKTGQPLGKSYGAAVSKHESAHLVA
ncbi:hypothetical protein QBC32DRAFT_229686 [Pseudoneurospora amorphoporcata]|uniref:Uncharacterized protein n=1 Tax=Pseudoneurospora amorphoporcata TaxID=241081 RepID=A0AAN6P0I2_9PEZI|nr:hypothetical protein QBC32DRAFT_229686 [Pseudoneurospora amorphoporcata]